jgi:uncharacterized protein YggE
MRRILLAALLLAVLIPLAVPAQTPRDSVLAVNTMRSVRLTPDRATLFLAVDGTAETSQDALARGNAKMTAVLAALRAMGPTVEVGRPSIYALGPTSTRGYPMPPQSTPTITARLTVRVHVNDLGNLSRVLAAAHDAGPASISSLSYEATASDSVRRANLAAAVEESRLDAEALARALGGRITGMVDATITTNDRAGFGPTMLAFEGNFNQAAAPEVLLSMNLSVRFRFAR